MSTMPPISRSRSAPEMCVTSPAASICASQARKSCFGALDFAEAARGSTLVFMASLQTPRELSITVPGGRYQRANAVTSLRRVIT